MVTYSSEVGDGHSAISDCDKVSDNVTWLFELLGRNREFDSNDTGKSCVSRIDSKTY